MTPSPSCSARACSEPCKFLQKLNKHARFCRFRPTSDGSAAAILASEDFVKKHGLESQAVEILAQSMATDLPSSFTEKNVMKVVSF